VSDNKRLVVKVGSSLLANTDALTLRYAFMHGLISDIARLRSAGYDVILMSSGAVALGLNALGKKPGEAKLAEKQAAAACGQPLLLNAYRQISQEFRFDIAQLLVSVEDMESRNRYLNIRTTIETLFERGIVPIINENDTVATEELRVGDNDRLAAKVAQMVQGDELVILTSVDGLYDRDPSEPGAEFIEQLQDVSSYLEVTEGTSALGSGGMKTKLQAANMAQQVGCTTRIGEGVVEAPISDLLEGRRRHTRCDAIGSPASAWASWITNRLQVAGSLVVQQETSEMLKDGVMDLEIQHLAEIHGEFARGDVVHVYDQTGEELARGLTNFSAAELEIMHRCGEETVAEVIPRASDDCVIDRKNLVRVESHVLPWEFEPKDSSDMAA
jgi:glutamate 5-kinase